MKDVVGSPGTWSGLALRVAQCASTAASLLIFFAGDDGVSVYSASLCLLLSMALQLIWSFCLMCVDVCSLWKKFDLHHRQAVWPIVIGDWFMAIGSLAAASASADVLMFLERDTHLCRIALRRVPCGQDTTTIILAFMAWSFIAASAISSFSLLAAL